jgi:hypothetical protein
MAYLKVKMPRCLNSMPRWCMGGMEVKLHSFQMFLGNICDEAQKYHGPDCSEGPRPLAFQMDTRFKFTVELLTSVTFRASRSFLFILDETKGS